MYKVQRGALPFIASLFGAFLLVLGMFVSLNFAIPDVMGYVSQRPFSAANLAVDILANVITMLFMLSPLWFIGAFLVSLFPEIRLVENGVKYRVLVFTGILKWREIDHVIRLRNDYVAVTINRKGLYFLNGLYFNRLQGIFIRHEQPVLLLAPGLEDREALLQEIVGRIRNGVISEASSLYT